MKCPRCQIELEDGRCPKCEWVPSVPAQKSLHKPSKGQSPLGFPMEFTTSPLQPTTQDWRSELREKLKKHYNEKGDAPASETEAKLSKTVELPVPPVKPPKPPRAEPAGPAPSSASASSPATPPVFQYEMADPSPGTPKVVTFKKSPGTATSVPGVTKDKPLIRPPLKTRVVTRKPSIQQRPLTLETLRSSLPARREERPAQPEPKADFLSPEILLSRFLAFIIDLLVAVGTGFGFAFAGSSLLGTAFPSPDSLWIAGLSSVGCFFLNSVFLLYTIGQTPGMIVTNLQLIPQDTDRLLLSAVFVRVLAFVPIAATVLGLVWGLFDPLRRCWHDHLSATRVVYQDR